MSAPWGREKNGYAASGTFEEEKEKVQGKGPMGFFSFYNQVHQHWLRVTSKALCVKWDSETTQIVEESQLQTCHSEALGELEYYIT